MNAAKPPAMHMTAPTIENDAAQMLASATVEKAWSRSRFHESEKTWVYIYPSTRLTRGLTGTSFLPPNQT